MKTVTVQHVNFWEDPFNEKWLFNFIKNIYKNEYNIVLVKGRKQCDILISSVYGNLLNVSKYNAKLKIFFYGENLNRDCYKQYSDINNLGKYFDLIVGFLPTNIDRKTVRFPLWLIYYPFYDVKDEDNIIDYINEQRKNNIEYNKKYFASCITRRDIDNIRGRLCDVVEKYGDVMYPSKFRKNCSIGPTQMDKVNFLKSVKYNICPENSVFPKYCTEKIFHALEAGCVPIYWGEGYPEDNIINRDCYIFIDLNGDIDKQICSCLDNYDKIVNNNIFVEGAKTIIKGFYDSLENSIRNNIKL